MILPAISIKEPWAAMKLRKKMKVYQTKKQAEINEGIICGIDDSVYETIEDAEADFPYDSGVFAWYDDDEKIRVGWTAK